MGGARGCCKDSERKGLLGTGVGGVVVEEGKTRARTEESRELGYGAQRPLQVDKSMHFRIDTDRKKVGLHYL